ncbi:hypothetical protein M3Y99_01667400 [Aphelenchoides fujianensis]|nr:hypothetical protein M3Y99_01667400 [Aphelenchoides fujianensis]
MGKYDQYLRYVSLVVLVIQNTSQVLTMRYATTRDQTQFIKSVAVFFNEVVKLAAATALFLVATGSFRKAGRDFKQHFFVEWVETLKVALPALIYTVQNFLLYVAVANLDAGTFMVLYQMKTLTTALFTVLMLKRKLSVWQWLALVVLAGGVGLVQWSADEGAKEAARTAKDLAAGLNATLNSTTALPTTLKPAEVRDAQQPFVGFLAVMAACVMSGFAGIWFEKILKGSNVSIWLRNIQLAVFALPISLILIAGFMVGFDYLVWIVIGLQSLGGLVIAVVVKYADNILKAFATSVAIVVATPLFMVGAGLVMAAVAIYSVFPYRPKYAEAPTSDPAATETKDESGLPLTEDASAVELKVVK